MMTGDNRYEVSPLAEIFAPPGTGGAVKGLSIGGFERPVLLWAGRIVFGLDTYEACRANGIEQRFEELSGGVFPLERIIREATASSDMSRSQRGIAAHKISRMSSDGWAALGLPSDVAAHLPKYNQRQAASLLGVGPGLVSIAGRVFGGDGQASLELQRAAEQGLLTLSSAGKLLDVPPSMQQWLVEQLRSGTVRKAAGVLETVVREAARREREENPETFLPDPASVNRFRERIDPTLHHAPMEDLHRLVGAATVDAIVTCPAVTARGLGTLPDLVALADHVLKPSGLLVVLAHPKHLEQIVLGLANPDLQHLDAPCVILPKSRRIPGRAPLSHRGRYVLLYGRPGTELPPGGDIIQAQKPGGGCQPIWSWNELCARCSGGTRAGEIRCSIPPCWGGPPWPWRPWHWAGRSSALTGICTRWKWCSADWRRWIWAAWSPDEGPQGDGACRASSRSWIWILLQAKSSSPPCRVVIHGTGFPCSIGFSSDGEV